METSLAFRSLCGIDRMALTGALASKRAVKLGGPSFRKASLVGPRLTRLARLLRAFVLEGARLTGFAAVPLLAYNVVTARFWSGEIHRRKATQIGSFRNRSNVPSVQRKPV